MAHTLVVIVSISAQACVRSIMPTSHGPCIGAHTCSRDLGCPLGDHGGCQPQSIRTTANEEDSPGGGKGNGRSSSRTQHTEWNDEEYWPRWNGYDGGNHLLGGYAFDSDTYDDEDVEPVGSPH